MSASPISTVEHAICLLGYDERGCFLHSAFFDAGIDLRIGGNESTSAFSAITHDLWNISTLATRLDWMRRLAVEGNLDSGTWRTFSQLDIENFFVQVRSAMDHVAEVLDHLSSKPGQLPESFQRLRSSIDKYASKLPESIPELVVATTWFDEMRSIRDTLVHKGGQSVVFGEPHDGILFQVHGPTFQRGISYKAFMYNEHVVHFDRYAALLFANVLSFLEKVGVALGPVKQSAFSVGAVRSYSSGLEVLERWLHESLESLRAHRDTETSLPSVRPVDKSGRSISKSERPPSV